MKAAAFSCSQITSNKNVGCDTTKSHARKWLNKNMQAKYNKKLG